MTAAQLAAELEEAARMAENGAEGEEWKAHAEIFRTAAAAFRKKSKSEAKWPFNLLKELGVYAAEHERDFYERNLETAMGKLSSGERDILIERYKNGLSYVKIGHLYGFTRQRAHQKAGGALARLKSPWLQSLVIIGEEEYEAVRAMARESSIAVFGRNAGMEDAWSGMENEMPDITLRETNLSRRAKTCLSRSGIKTLRQLCCLSSGEISRLRGVGKKTAWELTGKLEEYAVRIRNKPQAENI